MKASDIVRIIRECRKSGVKTLRLGELSLEFTLSDGGTVEIQPDFYASSLGQGHVPGKLAETQADQEQLALLEQTISLKEEQTANLSITDPERFEELITEGDLRSGEEEDDRGLKQII